MKFIIIICIQDANTIKVHAESFRRVERGARLLIAIRSSTACLLQMPRGNLELIHPRVLLISMLKFEIEK